MRFLFSAPIKVAIVELNPLYKKLIAKIALAPINLQPDIAQLRQTILQTQAWINWNIHKDDESDQLESEIAQSPLAELAPSAVPEGPLT